MPFKTASYQQPSLQMDRRDPSEEKCKDGEFVRSEIRTSVVRFGCMPGTQRGSHNMGSVCRTISMAAVILLFCTRWTFGQAGATISGTIADPSGAAIPGATVEVTNQSTNVVRKTITNATGNYQVANLIPGQYTITVVKGFGTAERSAFPLQGGAVDVINLTLTVGA